MIHESVGSIVAGAPAIARRRWTRGLAAVLTVAAVGLLVSACGVAGIGDPADAGRDKVTAQQKNDAKAALNNLVRDLHALDAAYSAGDMAEARSDLDEAEADWRKIIPAATVQDQSDVQVRFDRLTNNLSSKASAKTVSDGVNAFVAELDHDVAPGLG